MGFYFEHQISHFEHYWFGPLGWTLLSRWKLDHMDLTWAKIHEGCPCVTNNPHCRCQKVVGLYSIFVHLDGQLKNNSVVVIVRIPIRFLVKVPSVKLFSHNLIHIVNALEDEVTFVSWVFKMSRGSICILLTWLLKASTGLSSKTQGPSVARDSRR